MFAHVNELTDQRFKSIAYVSNKINKYFHSFSVYLVLVFLFDSKNIHFIFKKEINNKTKFV